MRWIMDALQHARYKQPSCGVSLSGFLSEAGGAMKEKTQSTSSHLDYLPSPAPSPETSRKLNSDLHGLSDEEGSSEVFLATDSDYDSSRAQSPKELDLVYSSTGPECCSRRVARTLRDSAPDVLQTHELKTPPLPPPPPEEPRPPPELYDSDFVLPSRQIELLRITEKRGSEPVFRTHSAEWTQSFQEQPDQPGSLADRGKKPGSVTLRVCPQYETGLSKETSVKLHITSQTSAGEVVKLVVLEMNDVSRGMLGGSAAFCYGEEQLEHFGLVFASEESERWLPDDFLPLSLQTTWPEGRFYIRIKETSPLVLQYGPATTV
nr:PREDICTED: uncharacterized protein LOC104333679 [Opisthocomus hoazin]